MRIFQRLTRTDGSRRPSSLVVLAAAPLMALGLAVGVTAPAQDAQVIDVSMESRAAESALTGCSGQSNRLLRFVGGSYVTKHDVCRVGEALAVEQARLGAMALANRALEAERDGAIARADTLQAEVTALGQCRADELQAELDQREAETNTLLAMQESLTTQIAGLDQRVEACQAGMEGQASTEADLRDQIAALQAELVARDATIARLEQEAAAASAAEGHDDSRVTALLAMAEKRAADLERTTTALNAALSRKAALEGEARQAEAARAALQAELAAAEAAARQASDDSAAEIARMQSLLDQALSQAEAAQTDFAAVGEMAGDLAAAQAEIERLEGVIEADAGAAEATPAATALNQGLQAWSAVASQARPEVEGLALPGDSLVLSGSESIFLTGSAEISETGQALLDELAAEILSIMATLPADADWRLEVQGHADIRPTGARWPSNWELSAYRASAAVRALAEAGVPVERLAAVGLGEYHPLVDEATQAAYAMNRRLELRFR
ncbi:MAG: OmpA family protein [Alphaproteobacteria bacterium]